MKRILLILLFAVISISAFSQPYRYILNSRTGKFDLVQDSVMHNSAFSDSIAIYDTIRFSDGSTMYLYSQRNDTIPVISIDSIAIPFDSLAVDIDTYLTDYTFSDSITVDNVLNVLNTLYVNGNLYLPDTATIYIGDSAVSLNMDHIPANAFLYKYNDSIYGETGIKRDANGILFSDTKRLSWSSSKYIIGTGGYMDFYNTNLIFGLSSTGLVMENQYDSPGLNIESSSSTNPTMSPFNGGLDQGTGFGGLYTAFGTPELHYLSAIINSSEEMRWEYDTTRCYSNLADFDKDILARNLLLTSDGEESASVSVLRNTESNNSIYIGGDGVVTGSKQVTIFGGEQINLYSYLGQLYVGYDSTNTTLYSDGMLFRDSNDTLANLQDIRDITDTLSSLVVNNNLTVEKTITLGTGIIADNDATPDVSSASIYTYNGTANAVVVTDLDNPVVGTIYRIIGNSDTYTITINDSGNFNLSAQWVGGIDDVITIYVQADNDYIEVSRSDN